MSVKGGLTPEGTRPRGRGPGKKPRAKRPGRNRPAKGYVPADPPRTYDGAWVRP